MHHETQKIRRLFCGDNLDILKSDAIETASVDLIYLDPPFNSNQQYNLPFKQLGKDAAAVEAFKDRWYWDDETRALEQRLKTEAATCALWNYIENVKALRGGKDSLTAYLVNMAIRINELKRVMKPTAMLYLHCDPTASHYLKLILDHVFSPANYRNEIVWCYSGGGIPKSDFPRKHDVILRYSKTGNYKYVPLYRPYSPGTVKRGRTAVKGKYFEQGLREEGTPVQDWWTDIPKITSPDDPEKLGYPTQKHTALLERIIGCSTDSEEDVVFDPFCGCGTTLHVAEKLNRNWIGIDISRFSVGMVRSRLIESFERRIADHIEISGVPATPEAAGQLAHDNPWEFEKWVCGQLGARGLYKRRGEKDSDDGIDGVIEFYANPGNKSFAIVQVKGGVIKPNDVKALYADVLTEPEATAGIFVCFEKYRHTAKNAAPSKTFRDQIAGSEWPVIQVLSVEEMLAGSMPKLPNQVIQQGFKTKTRQRGLLSQAHGEDGPSVRERPRGAKS